jgi:hypothetical protein
VIVTGRAHAQEAAAAATSVEVQPEVTAEAAPVTAPMEAPVTLQHAAIVLVGDANADALHDVARTESALAPVVAFPSDVTLRRSLIGGEGETIPTVMRDRRALGSSEAEDVPLLGSLGDRSDAHVIVVVRRRAGARELVVFDVAHGAFFDGALRLEGASDEAIASFVRSRAEASRLPSVRPPTLSETERAVNAAIAPPPVSAPAEPHQPDWFETNWPYLVVGALAAGAAAFVIVYATQNDSQPQPFFRFQPGGAQ